MHRITRRFWIGICTRAAASLREGLEETLTLHRLDVQAPCAIASELNFIVLW